MKKFMMTIAMMAITVCMMAANNTEGDFPEKVTTDQFTFKLNTKKWKYNGSQKNESIRIQTINDPKISVNISTSTIAWEHWKNAKSKSYTAGKVVKKGGKSFETFFSGSPEEGSSKYSFGMWAGIPINPKGNIEIYIIGRKNPDQKPKDLVYPILDEVLSMLKFK
jgi:hypothetical protein